MVRGGPSLENAPRLVLEEEIPAFPLPTKAFFGFLAPPTSKNSRKRLTRLCPNHDSEPFLRLRATSKMVSSRLKHEQQIQSEHLGPDQIDKHFWLECFLCCHLLIKHRHIRMKNSKTGYVCSQFWAYWQHLTFFFMNPVFRQIRKQVSLGFQSNFTFKLSVCGKCWCLGDFFCTNITGINQCFSFYKSMIP